MGKTLEQYFKRTVGDVLNLSNNPTAINYLKFAVNNLPSRVTIQDERRPIYLLPASKVAAILKEIIEHNSNDAPGLRLRSQKESADRILKELSEPKKNSYA
jgi:hypothetical protein